ncbi:hypothetical protein K3G63_06715 [Hymenobacter sp. HSC-4F20]|uniref:hypothetical protein n=1 Tax=Hymenobacter sp. HSC-4F20 TaxID=2864135 RepID=UPI001C7321A9|nr:hypothetical protein [Hymenobacter sp. HSC-4F20]MBX0290123.1 hypothetical protein [Hymenobacter sp. HSC-4F20]
MTEILSLLSDYLISFFGFTAIYICIVLVSDSILDSALLSGEQIDFIGRLFIYPKGTSGYRQNQIAFSALFLGILLTILFLSMETNIVIIIFVLFAVVLMFCLVIGARQIFKWQRKIGFDNESLLYNKKLKTAINIIAGVFSFLLLNSAIALCQGVDLKEMSTNKNVVIEYEQKFIKSTLDYIYIGRTKNYTFFYNRKTGVAHVYPNSEIKRIYMINSVIKYKDAVTLAEQVRNWWYNRDLSSLY